MDLFFIVFILFIFQLAPPPTMCQDDYNAVMTNDHEDSLDTDQNANYDQADLLSELRDNWNYPLRYLQKRGYTGDISEIEEGADANNETVPAPTNSTNAPEAPAEVNTTTVKPSFLGKLKNMWSKIISPGGNLSDSVMLDTPELYEAINEILEVGKNRRSVPFDCSQCTNCSSPIKPGNSSSPAQVQTTTATAVTTTKAPTTTTARTATNNPASAGELKMEDIEFLRKFIQCLQSKQEILKKVEQSKNITTASAAKGTTPKPSKNQSVPTTASKAANSAKTSCATDGSKNTTDPKRWFHSHMEVWVIAIILTFCIIIAMACCENLRRTAPTNFIMLGLFTICQSVVVGMAVSRFHSQEVLLAVGMTAAVCLGLTLFAFQTKWDFTVMGGILFVAVIILILFGFIAMFFPGKTITLVYASVGALIFCVYLIYDTQLMMGGEHKYSISPEEYIFAALNLYLDIINIFLYILTIIGASRD